MDRPWWSARRAAMSKFIRGHLVALLCLSVHYQGTTLLSGLAAIRGDVSGHLRARVLQQSRAARSGAKAGSLNGRCSARHVRDKCVSARALGGEALGVRGNVVVRRDLRCNATILELDRGLAAVLRRRPRYGHDDGRGHAPCFSGIRCRQSLRSICGGPRRRPGPAGARRPIRDPLYLDSAHGFGRAVSAR